MKTPTVFGFVGNAAAVVIAATPTAQPPKKPPGKQRSLVMSTATKNLLGGCPGWVPGITPTMLEVDRERRKRIVVCETVAAITPHLRAVTKRRVPARRCIVLVVCETVAAITPHLRRVTDEHPIRLSGHSNKPKALCGREINWDTKLPLSSARCALCLKAAH